MDKSTKHIPKHQLERMLGGDCDDELDRQLGEHLARCAQCQSLLDELAATPKMWEKALELISEPLMSELAVKRAAASYGAQSEELTGNYERVEMSRDSAEFVLDPPKHPEMLGRIGDYDIEREVGRGGMGIVFKAFDTELHRPLAVKVLAPWLAQNGTARKRFAREARAAAAVIHPNVISIYGVNASKKTPYLVMPFVAGPSLQRLIDEHGPLEEKDIVRIAMQVAAGLGAAHAQALVHRDIKPANILVEPEVSRVLVTDFGLARAVDDASATQSGYFVGTPNYMSPEQATGKRVDGRSDLFSLGSVIYFMATGRMPFRAESPLCVLNRISHDEPTGIQQVNNEISKTLADVVTKLLEKNPEDRFQSAGEVYETMEKYLAYLHQPDVSKPPTIVLRKRNQESRWASRRRVSSFVMAGLLTTVFGLAFARGWMPTPNWMGARPTGTVSEENAKNGSANDSKNPWSKPDNDTPRDGNSTGAWNADPSNSPAPSNDRWEETTSDAGKLGGSGGRPPNDSSTDWDGELVGEVGVPGKFVTAKKWGMGKNIDGYTLYLPESYTKEAAPYPIIFHLQGALGVGGEVSQVNQWGLPKLVNDLRDKDNELSRLVRDRFVIISPHITSGRYDEDVMAMKQIIRDVASNHGVDESRVYVTGISRGGTGTWAMASRLEGIFAAAAPLAGQPIGIERKDLLAKTPMWIAHNTGDEFTPVAKMVTKLNKLSKVPFKAVDADTELHADDLNHSRILMTGETDDHDAWTRVYADPNFYRWLLNQRRW